MESKFREFQSATSTEKQCYSVYASWWLSYVLGGIASGFCAFYICCAMLAVVLSPFKLLKKKLSSAE